MRRKPLGNAWMVALALAAPCATGAQPVTERPLRAPSATPLSLPAARVALTDAFAAIRAPAGFRSGQWGALVIDAETGDTLLSLNSEQVFVPASGQKLVTAAAALATLGPEFRFTTRLATAVQVRDGTLEGDLVVFGTGDPSFSDRMREGDAVVPLRELADSLRALGIVRIDGALRRGAPVFTDSPIGFGWAWDDLSAAYGATVGDLMFNDTFAAVQVRIAGVVDTTPGRRPTHAHFLDALYSALHERGITVRAAYDWNSTVADTGMRTLVSFASPPLRDILFHFQKESQNQIGEVLLKTMGRVVAGAGRADSGAAVVARYLRGIGADTSGFVVRDGSGLSRHNWLSPATLVRVLHSARRDSTYALFRESLPVAGVDGTLERRMRGTAAAGSVRAKTGSMDRVRALAGYVTTVSGHELVFAVFANGYTASAREVDAAFDQIAVQLAALSLAR